MHDDLREYCCTGAVRSAPQWEGGCRCIAAFVPNGDVVPKQVFHWYPGVGRPRHGRGSTGRARAQLLYRIRGEHFLITLPKVRWSTHVSRRQPAQSARKGTAPGAFPTQWANMHRSLFIKLVNTTLSKVVTCLHPERIDPMNIAALPTTSPAFRDRNPSITEEFDQHRSQSKRQGHFLHWRPFCSM